MRKYQNEESGTMWGLGGVAVMVGMITHAVDVYRRHLPERSLAYQLAWMGHPSWNVLSGVGVALIMRALREVNEPWCAASRPCSA